LKLRRLVAPLSIAVLILVAGLAFNLHLQTRTEYPPAILDPEFDLWVSASNASASRLMVWDVEYGKGAGDQIRLEKTTLSDRKALEIQLYQNGTEDTWVFVHLTQWIDGARLRALFDMQVSVWVFAEQPCACKPVSNSQPVIFGVETNDETHVISFIFSNRTYEPQQSPSHRTVVLPTPAEEWTLHNIDLAREYDNAQWKRPDHLTFSIIFEAARSAVGWHTAYVHRFSWTRKSNISATQQNSGELMTLFGLWPGVQWTDVERIMCQWPCSVSVPQGSSSDPYGNVARV
jgi:hypothetical protein